MESLERDKAILLAGGIDAVKLILGKLDKAADEMAKEYDAIDYAREPDKAIRVQMFRRIAKIEIPRIVENIITHDRPDSAPKWNFWSWLSLKMREE